jgi:hypothetical protein
MLLGAALALYASRYDRCFQGARLDRLDLEKARQLQFTATSWLANVVVASSQLLLNYDFFPWRRHETGRVGPAVFFLDLGPCRST